MSAAELLGIAIGCVLLALGAAAIVAWTLRRSAARLLGLFGICCALYALRMLASEPSVRAALGLSRDSARYIVAIVTYAINVPIGLFVEALIGTGWRRSIRRLWQAQAAYAIVATLVDLSSQPLAAMWLNSPIVLTGVAIALANLWVYRDRIPPLFRNRAILAGAITLMLFALNENVGRPVAPRLNLEPLGMLTFVAALGYAVVGTVLRGEAELVAVQRELDTARRIQESLLPREPPRVQGLDVALRYRPMTAVAGDLYDFAVLGPTRLGILVADVAGHGVPAALVASMVKLAFSTQSAEADDPAALLTAMNRVLCRHVERAFVTAVYAVVDTARATVTVANAGHPALLVGRADGRVEPIEERGLVLGFFDQAPYANAERPLFTGDRILLYTDGIPEAQNPRGEFFDSDRLHAWLARDGDAASIAETALRDLRRWRGADGFDDDVTLVVARCGR